MSQSTAEAGELSPRDPVEGRGHRQVAPVEGKTANTPRVGPVSTSRQTDSRTGQISLGDGGGHRLASWTSGYATARSEAICRGAGCGRTRTSGSVGGQGQQRPWSTRPPRSLTTTLGHYFHVGDRQGDARPRGGPLLEVQAGGRGRVDPRGGAASSSDELTDEESKKNG